MRRAKSTIADLIETISNGNWQGREAELYDYIGARIHGVDGANSGWSDSIARVNGRADADRMWKQMQHLGVAGTKSGIPNTRAKLVQRLKDATLSEAQRASIQAQIDALPQGATLKAMRDKFKNEVLRPWYLKNVDSTATKATYQEMAEKIAPMVLLAK